MVGLGPVHFSGVDRRTTTPLMFLGFMTWLLIVIQEMSTLSTHRTLTWPTHLDVNTVVACSL